MLTMNVFNQDAFSPVQLSAAIDQMDYIPDLLDNMPGLFVPDPVRTETIWIENRSFSPTILPFSPRGAPPHQVGGDQAQGAQLSHAALWRCLAHHGERVAVQIRAFGSEVDLKRPAERGRAPAVQDEAATFALTREYHKFNLVTGAV
jgi:hypothetical protein